MAGSARGAKLSGTPIAAGDVLLGRYRVERCIGEGGTGVILEAVDTTREDAPRVAIKVLRMALASDEVRTRFEREARAINTVASEHVVVVHETGVLDDGAPYMVMEHLEGRDLARVLKEDGPLAPELAVDCMLQVCSALSVAHARGIVHRDLKPANLFLTRRANGVPQVKIVDFGLSKFIDKRSRGDAAGGAGGVSEAGALAGDEFPAHEVTTAFAALGSPRYMAPEQVRDSKTVDCRADLWSVGAVLYQLVSGRHAFPAETGVQATVAVLSHDPDGLAQHVPGLPEGLEAVIRRCLARDVDARFQSADALADALVPFASLRARGSLARLRGAAARNAPTEPKLRAAPPEPSTPPPDPPSGKREPSAPPKPSDARAAPEARDVREGPRASLAFPVLAGAVVLLLVAGIVAARAAGGSAPAGATVPPIPTPQAGLDAGRRAP